MRLGQDVTCHQSFLMVAIACVKEAALCGVHCLNALLQGPFFGAIELGQIAQELDAMERKFMSESGIESEDYMRFIEEDSGNVSSDGFFSIQARWCYLFSCLPACPSKVCILTMPAHVGPQQSFASFWAFLHEPGQS